MWDDNDGGVPDEMDPDGNALPPPPPSLTATDQYSDNDNGQQSTLNQFKIDLCREDLIYLNDHKEVEAIATLLLKKILKKKPRNPHEFAASYLSDPQTSDLVTNYSRIGDSLGREFFERETRMHATATNSCDQSVEPSLAEQEE